MDNSDPEISVRVRVCTREIENDLKVTQFLARLKDPRSDERVKARRNSGDLGWITFWLAEGLQKVQPFLMNSLQDKEVKVRKWALWALPRSQLAVVQIAIQIIRNSNADPELRCYAASKLGSFG